MTRHAPAPKALVLLLVVLAIGIAGADARRPARRLANFVYASPSFGSLLAAKSAYLSSLASAWSVPHFYGSWGLGAPTAALNGARLAAPPPPPATAEPAAAVAEPTDLPAVVGAGSGPSTGMAPPPPLMFPPAGPL